MTRTVARRLACTLLPATVGLAWPAAAASKWVEVKSPNFTVYSDADAKEARQVALQFEQVRLAFEKLWAGARTRSARPVVILAVRNEGGLKALLPDYFERKGGMRPAGFTVSGSHKSYVALRTDVDDVVLQGYNPYHLLYHEYIHVLVGLNVNRVPPWFGEGLAEFFGATIVEGDRLVIGKPLPWHILDLRGRAMFDLPRLIAVDHDSPEYNEETKSGIFYAQSWALVHMLIIDPTGDGPRRVNDLLVRLRRGEDAEAASRAALGDLAALDKRLNTYVRRPAFQYTRVDFDARVDGRAFPVRDVPAAEALALQGDFHVHRGAYALARPLLEDAARQDPKLALAQEALGVLTWREKGLAEAQPFFKRAVELDTGSFLAHFLLAWPLLEQGTPDALAQAQVSLEKAIELNHDYAPAYDALARAIGRRGGDLGLALGLARRAVSLEPGEADYRVSVSWLLDSAGKHQEALQEAQRAVGAARDAGDRQRAQDWLDTLGRSASAPAPAARAGWRVVAPPRPVAEQERGCAAGQLADCAALGDRYASGDGVAEDHARALALYRQACDGGQADACGSLATALIAGSLGPRDPGAGARALGQACDAGALRDCAHAGLMFAFTAEVPRDEARAAGYLRKGCDAGEARACGGLGVLHMKGAGVTRDFVRAAALLEKACAVADPTSCMNLAGLLESGAGVRKDPARARELYAQACEKGVAPACDKAKPAPR